MNLADPQLFEQVFKQHYTELCRYAQRYLKTGAEAEELVQQVFVHLWERAPFLRITGQIRPYLYQTVKHRCLNSLRKQYQQAAEEPRWDTYSTSRNPVEDQLNEKDLEQILDLAVKALPEKTRLVFLLHRQSGLSYQQVAQELSLSIKTVETHMGTALKRLRVFLEKHWISLVLLASLLSKGA